MRWDNKLKEIFGVINGLCPYDMDLGTIFIKQVMKQGIEKGKQEGEKQKAIQIARNLLDVLDVATIANKTGLSVEEIDKLNEEK
ncbi:MAG: hypothetical protein LBT07_02915 [Endomicrobium sp.]|jgi:hypothetical protein|nr:hypothetical protein [Endomicrobium sp.]